MLFTTFLLATSVATSGVLGGMLLKRQKDAVPTKVPYGALATVAMAIGLTILGFTLV